MGVRVRKKPQWNFCLPHCANEDYPCMNKPRLFRAQSWLHHLCVDDRNSQPDRRAEDVTVEDMKGSGVSSWQLYPREAIDLLANTHLPIVGVHLTFTVSPQ